MNSELTRSLLRTGGAVLVLGCLQHAHAQLTTLVNVATNGTQANSTSYMGRLSGDGSTVVFMSAASSLTSNDNNNVYDVFVRDLVANTTSCISRNVNGTATANGTSETPTVTPDGRYVAFSSFANDLLGGDTNNHEDVFFLDRQTGALTRVSLTWNGGQADGASGGPALSDDGRYVAFSSSATNLVTGDTNGAMDIFVRDRVGGTTTRVSLTSSGAQSNSGYTTAGPSLSGDGRYVVFYSYASDLVTPDANGNNADVFLKDRQTGSLTMVDVSTAGVQANMTTTPAGISSDGRYVAFFTRADNLVPGDTASNMDLFIRDRVNGTTTRVNTDANGNEAHGTLYFTAFDAQIAPSGLWVTFASDAYDLVPGDSLGSTDVFAKNLVSGAIRRVNLDSIGNVANGWSAQPSISSDGKKVAFYSQATNLVSNDNNSFDDLFLRDENPPPCPSIISYCTAKTNSQGCFPVIGSSGTPQLSGADNFLITGSNVLNMHFGQFFWGHTPTAAPFHGGTMCVLPPFVRTQPQSSFGSPAGVDCTGSYSFHFSQAYMLANGLNGGALIYGQFYSRDSGFVSPANVGLTNAIRFTICP